MKIADSSRQRDNDDQYGFHRLALSMATGYKADAAQVASLALSSNERRGFGADLALPAT